MLASEESLDTSWCLIDPLCSNISFCGLADLSKKLILMIALWLLGFYSLSAVAKPLFGTWLQRNPSKYASEETSFWLARHIVSLLHSSWIVWVSLGPVVFSTGSSWETLLITPRDDDGGALAYACAKGGLIFTSFIMYDLVIVIVHRFDGPLMIVHHIVFLLFCAMVMHHCFLQYISTGMMTMEMSTIFLNHYSFFRNRWGSDHWSVMVSFGCFGITYLVWRVAFMGYLVYGFFKALLDRSFPWHRCGGGGHLSSLRLGFIGVCLVAALALQLAWLIAGIWPKVKRILLRKGKSH